MDTKWPSKKESFKVKILCETSEVSGSLGVEAHKLTKKKASSLQLAMTNPWSKRKYYLVNF